MANEITPPTETTEQPPQADVVARDSIANEEGLEAVELPPEPAHFEDWDLAPTLMRALSDMGYERPMPVQEAVFKTLTEGNDLMVQSKTGSGKTSGFGIPIAQMLSGGEKGVQALILAPTRELALQVAKEIQKLVIHMDVAVVPIYGGAPIGPQIRKLEAGGQIVAGTPGRVLDHIRRGTMDTSGIRMLVLDECDEMLSMGFQEEIENIVETLPPKDKRQTMLFSATIPKEIERIGRRHMRDPEMLTLSSDSVGAELIDHYYYVVSGMARNRDLLKLMKAEKPESAIIFCNTRDETNSVARYLRKNGYDAEALSSDLSQSDRERVMGRMRDKNLNFLVATDIAARGIDISELSHVINYTFPASPEVYVHRSGRTGRAGKEGTALSLVGPREIGAFYYLKLIYKIIPTERDLPNADEMAAIEEGELYERVTAMVEGEAKKEHIALARRLWQSTQGERVVALLLQRLLSGETAKAAPTKAVASEPRRDAEASDAVSEERPRRKRRRRREQEESEQPVEAAVAAEGAAEEPAEDAEERPRRKRRRRRRRESEELSAASETSSDDSEEKAEAVEAAPVDADEAPEVEAAPAAEVVEAEAAAEASAAPEAEAEVEVAADEQPEERPRRKRRRRRSERVEASEESETAKAASEEEDPGETQEVTRRDVNYAPVKTPRKKKVKARARKPRTDAGEHLEFWEAWADSKSETQDEDVATANSSEASEEAEEKPQRKRRRRRRGSKQAAEEVLADDSASEETSTEAEESTDSGDEEPSQPTVRLFVNVGKREDADVDAIRSFLGEALGDSAEHLGRITLRNTHCYIRVPEEAADEVIDVCNGLVFHEREVVVERARARR